MKAKEKFFIIHSLIRCCISNTYTRINTSLLKPIIAKKYYNAQEPYPDYENVKERIIQKKIALRERFSRLRIPIKVKLSIAISLILGFAIIVLSLVILNRQKEQLYAQAVNTGKISLNYFTNNARIPILEDNILELNTLIKEAGTVDGLLYAIIVDRKQIIKAHTDYTRIGDKLNMLHNAEKRTIEGNTSYFNYTGPSGAAILNLSRPVIFKDKMLGEVHVGISLDFIKKQIFREGIFILILSFIIIMAGIGIAVLFGRGFSRPISTLVLATQEISKGNFQHRIENIQNNELGDLAVAFNHVSKELWVKSLMQESFGRYVSPEVLNMIMANPEDSWLKGIRSYATILLADIRGFTSYSAAREPEDVVDVLNEYFEITTQIILEYGGYVDKLIGDAVLGVFGVPVPRADHAERAVRAAVAMQRELQRAAQNGNRLLSNIGIGINSGIVVSGNIGSRIKMEYTVIGDVVNMADRLCSMAGSGEIIISKNIYQSMQDIIFVKKLPLQRIKGKSHLVETFQVLNIRESRNNTKDIPYDEKNMVCC